MKTIDNTLYNIQYEYNHTKNDRQLEYVLAYARKSHFFASTVPNVMCVLNIYCTTSSLGLVSFPCKCSSLIRCLLGSFSISSNDFALMAGHLSRTLCSTIAVGGHLNGKWTGPLSSVSSKSHIPTALSHLKGNTSDPWSILRHTPAYTWSARRTRTILYLFSSTHSVRHSA